MKETSSEELATHAGPESTDRELDHITRPGGAQGGALDWPTEPGQAVGKRVPSNPTVVERNNIGITSLVVVIARGIPGTMPCLANRRTIISNACTDLAAS